mmetsp:Transcript_166304/g.534084  ORF Transcript_166304/g.534084 Transcript_166304/m.534084 type:complete len:90 (+) Transcript_166304:524-793(+)
MQSRRRVSTVCLLAITALVASPERHESNQDGMRLGLWQHTRFSGEAPPSCAQCLFDLFRIKFAQWRGSSTNYLWVVVAQTPELPERLAR